MAAKKENKTATPAAKESSKIKRVRSRTRRGRLGGRSGDRYGGWCVSKTNC